MHVYVTWKPTPMLQVIRIVRFCSAFSLPIVSLLLPRQDCSAEERASVQDLANLIFVYSEAAVPKVAVLCTPQAVTAEKVPGWLAHVLPLPIPIFFCKGEQENGCSCTLTGDCGDLRAGRLWFRALQGCCVQYGSGCVTQTLAAESLAILLICLPYGSQRGLRSGASAW